MALSIQENQRYRGTSWDWSVWIDGSAEELDSIDHVMYILDWTFDHPVREVSDRATNFRLDDFTFGTFSFYAKIIHRDGHETVLTHELIVRYPDGRPAAA